MPDTTPGWVGDPHLHPFQFASRLCHDHDGFGYHCHDLAARPDAEPGRMYAQITTRQQPQ